MSEKAHNKTMKSQRKKLAQCSVFFVLFHAARGNELQMQVIKLGGSLSKSKDLSDCLNRIARNSKDNIIIVPGGGDFADQVRLAQQQWRFNDVIAHEMAILAMQQMALLFKGLQPNFILKSTVAEIKQQNYVTPIIWSPNINELNNAGIAASWDITSDSLAAWLAAQLNATELILVKAASVSTDNLAQLSEQGMIDRAFMRFAAQADFRIHIFNKDRFYEQQEFK
jgi:aspartokinase-like uncharacterized kinase